MIVLEKEKRLVSKREVVISDVQEVIPKEIYDIMREERDTYNFNDLILKELLTKGFSGEKLLKKFKEKKEKIEEAAEKYFAQVQKDYEAGKFLTSEQVFGRKIEKKEEWMLCIR